MTDSAPRARRAFPATAWAACSPSRRDAGAIRCPGAAIPDCAEEEREVAQLAVEERAHLGVERGLVERGAHAAEPRGGHRLVHGDARVAHPEARVAVLRHVVLGPAEPADEERCEALLRRRRDAAVGVAGV